MNKPLNFAILASTLIWAAAAQAQETTEDAAPAQEESNVENGLSLGEEVPQEQQEPQVGEAYLREVIGDWALRCLKAEEGNVDPCQLYQLLNDSEGNAVAEITIFPLPEGNRAVAGATIVAPLETQLTEQITIRIDGGDARRYPFTFCNAGGCVARVGFTAEEITLFKRGNAANLRMVPAAAPDQEVNLTMSLTGFTAAYDSLGS